ncbi:MAG: aminopeptidase P N-terminal domain-containing protein [Planctomycetota bacterium]
MRRPAPALVYLVLLAPLFAQATLPTPPAPLPASEFRTRREAVAKALVAAHPDQQLVVLVRGAAKVADMGPFVQDQDFLYLTGIAEPDLAILLMPSGDGSLARDELLVPPFSPFAATWDGRFLAPGDDAAKRTGFATVGNVRGLQEALATLLAKDGDGKRATLVTLTQPAARTGSTPRKAREAADARAKDTFDGRTSREEVLVDTLRRQHDGLRVVGLEGTVHALRARKSAGEIEVLRRCAAIAAAGIAEAMRSCEPGHHEFQLAAVARFQFSVSGAGTDAYAAIVGGGPNGCILHYNLCDRQLLASDLIVMDYAPTLHGYATDVTRTFPASGRFTPEQRKLVQDVYEIQQALIADVKPGAKLSVLGSKCEKMLVERGYRSIHGPCHHVGLAVHDPNADVLAPGMVITVEPGAYLRDRGMGCRIEDTILVTADGCELLSKDVPSTPDAIEALMAEPGLLGRPAVTAK